jgi:hypothetical protein
VNQGEVDADVGALLALEVPHVSILYAMDSCDLLEHDRRGAWQGGRKQCASPGFG